MARNIATGNTIFANGGGRFAVNSFVEARVEKYRSRSQRGFSLLELMISMFILILLLSIAVPTYQHSVRHAQETVLKENLWQMRRAIDQYATDKGKLPKSIDDLVQAKYLHEKPIDPIMQDTEWDEKTGPDPNSADGDEGLTDVKSRSTESDGEGKAYSDY